jgi:uncharacterized membrane protein
MKRMYSIDVVRGIVMMIMALDHVRDLMHVSSIIQSPTNLETTTPLLFFTRWVTHICAPSFVFLAGTSVYLSYKNAENRATTRRFLLKRGFYLLALEFVVVNFAIFFDPGFHILLFEVIAAIGFGFIVLSLLLNLSVVTIGVIGLVIIFGHNLLSLLPLEGYPWLKTVINFLFNQTAAPLSAGRVFVMAYPPIPWLGIMLVGFASGKLFLNSLQKRKQIWIAAGVAAIALFIGLRLLNIYGDPLPWASQKNAVYTFLSFLNVTKYPPSLQFCLLTLSIMFFKLAGAEGSKSKLMQVASVYGKVPLFYFIIHFFLIHLLMVGLLLLQGFSWNQMDFTSGAFGRPAGVSSGVELWVIYIIWIGVVALLYKPCLWFGAYKSKHTYWWLKYL